MEEIEENEMQHLMTAKTTAWDSGFLYLCTCMPYIFIDIIARLPVKSILICKAVQRKWLQLIESKEFVKSHFSKAMPCLAVSILDRQGTGYKIIELNDSVEIEDYQLHYNKVAFACQSDEDAPIKGSINGFLFLRNMDTESFIIHNPITGEHVSILFPPGFVDSTFEVLHFGFGKCEIKETTVYKTICIKQSRDVHKSVALRRVRGRCQVHTIGTGEWRRVKFSSDFIYDDFGRVSFLNDNLHWLVYSLDGSPCVSKFDIANEDFSTLSVPALPDHKRFQLVLCILEDYLCLCDDSSEYGVTAVWLMKKYGVGTSWVKQCNIDRIDLSGGNSTFFYPVKIFKNGGILLEWGCYHLLYNYESERFIRHMPSLFDERGPFHYNINAVSHIPSFHRLKDCSENRDVNISSNQKGITAAAENALVHCEAQYRTEVERATPSEDMQCLSELAETSDILKSNDGRYRDERITAENRDANISSNQKGITAAAENALVHCEVERATPSEDMENALALLDRKRQGLHSHLCSLEDTLALYEHIMDRVRDGGEVDLARRCIDHLISGSDHLLLKNEVQVQGNPQPVKQTKFPKIFLPGNSSCQDLEYTCLKNNWRLPRYFVQPSDGKFSSSVVVHCLGSILSAKGGWVSSPVEARESAAAQMMARIRGLVID